MASSKTLEQAIADITIWRKGEQRAPHKPLLLLHVLAGYQQGHGRLFDYGSEVRDPLIWATARAVPPRYALLALTGRWVLGATKLRALLNIRQQQTAPCRRTGGA